MLAKIMLLGAILFVIFGIFTYLSYKKIPNEYDYKLIRRLYYLLIMAYIAIFVVVFKNDIKKYHIINIQNANATIINALIIAISLFILSMFWEYIFISCKSFKNIKIKDFEITVDERKDIKHFDNLQDKEIKSLYNVLFAKIRMLKFINEYVEEREFLNPEEFYSDILQEYKNKRKNINIYIYKQNYKGYHQMQRDFNLTSKELSSIIYTIDMFGFCSPQKIKSKEHSFSRIKTKFADYDLLVVLESKLLVDGENYIIFDIINYFEQVVSLKIMECDYLQHSSNML